MDVVGEGDNDFAVAVGVLQGHLRHGVVLLPGHVNYIVMDGGLVFVDEGDKLPNASLIAHFLPLFLTDAGILHDDFQTCVEEGLLPHPAVKGVVVIDQLLEHFRVRLEHDFRAGVVGGAHHRHLLGHLAPGKLHLIDAAVFVHPNFRPGRAGVDHAGAHAVKTAGDLVAAAAELAASMEHGVDHLQRRFAGLGLNVHGDTTAVVGNGDGVALVDGHMDFVAVACQCLVNGVVHDLIHQVVQTGGAGGTDVHARAFPNSVQSLQHLNFRGAVFVLCCSSVF